MGRPNSEDSALSSGMRWASRVSTIGLEFALPPLGGVFLDRHWGTAPVLTIIGALLGFLIGMIHLLQIAREESSKRG